MAERHFIIGGWFHRTSPSPGVAKREWFVGMLKGHGSLLEGDMMDLPSTLRFELWNARLTPERLTFFKTYGSFGRNDPEALGNSTVDYEFELDGEHGRGRWSTKSGASGVAEIRLVELP